MADAAPVIVVLADDLIWGTRLARFVTDAGAVARSARSGEAFRGLLSGATLAIVDATARAYDPVAEIRAARAAAIPAVCVAQHDDATLRRAALDAGAERVVPYRLMAERGSELVMEWLERSEAAR